MNLTIALEHPAFRVEVKTPHFEIRQYEPTLVAETKSAAGQLRLLAPLEDRFPADMLIGLRQVPSRRIAVYRYTGSQNESRFKTNMESFTSELERYGVQTVGGPTRTRLNSRFWPGFLSENEIWMELGQ